MVLELCCGSLWNTAGAAHWESVQMDGHAGLLRIIVAVMNAAKRLPGSNAAVGRV